jgi:cysteinyl-tRNA synthetase
MADILSLTNTVTGAKKPFRPEDPTAIGMYVCGPTVYDRAHIGNARSAVAFDLLFRVLRHDFGEEAVTYARNFTDIDDKIIDRAATAFPDLSPQQAITRLTQQTTDWYHEDMDALGVLRPTHEPRATAYVNEMIDDIRKMIANGGAYAAGGHVFFSAEHNTHRGTLSGRIKLDDDAVSRIEPHPLKRHPADFVLWKPSKDEQPGWESPWGIGRPGWHIECSAMSTRILGQSFDIHGGGSDLTFPHHDNEISQARCCAPKADYARTWLHNGMVTIEGQKMSKSLGNVLTVEGLRSRLPGGALRLALLSAHYRSSLDWSAALEAQIGNAWQRFATLAKDVTPSAVPEAVLSALRDDMATPTVLAELHALAGAGEAQALRASLDLIGVSLLDDRLAMPDDIRDRIEDLVTARDAARKNKDFARSDALRDGLTASGLILKDTPQGTRWEAGLGFDAATLPTID